MTLSKLINGQNIPLTYDDKILIATNLLKEKYDYTDSEASLIVKNEIVAEKIIRKYMFGEDE